jgi:hypothetical protein
MLERYSGEHATDYENYLHSASRLHRFVEPNGTPLLSLLLVEPINNDLYRYLKLIRDIDRRVARFALFVFDQQFAQCDSEQQLIKRWEAGKKVKHGARSPIWTDPIGKNGKGILHWTPAGSEIKDCGWDALSDEDVLVIQIAVNQLCWALRDRLSQRDQLCNEWGELGVQVIRYSAPCSSIRTCIGRVFGR